MTREEGSEQTIEAAPPQQSAPEMHRSLSSPSSVFPAAPPEVVIFPRPQKASLIKKLIIDISVVGILGLSILFFNLWAVPYHRGFNCDDDSIRYPYHDDTISSSAVVAYSLSIPLVTILLNEFLIVRQAFSTDKSTTFFGSLHFWTCFGWQWYMQTVPFLFAVATSQMITEIAKYSIGRLRPHFLDYCQPEFLVGSTQVKLFRDSDCTAIHPYTYIVDYKCTNPNAQTKFLNDINKSFMSGHSSFSAVCLLYLVLYLQSRFTWTAFGLVKHLYQVGLVFLVFYTGMSRISDYKHHWSDVLIGLLQGTFVAIMVANFISDLFKLRSYYVAQSAVPPNETGGMSSNRSNGANRDSNV